MKSWLKENWFKVSLVILTLLFILVLKTGINFKIGGINSVDVNISGWVENEKPDPLDPLGLFKK